MTMADKGAPPLIDNDVHAAAATGYASSADTYAMGRPGYSPETAPWLTGVLGLGSGRLVLDLGAGTGKFLPNLRATGARLIALEPVMAMRARLERSNPDVEAVGGTATAIPLADASLDCVVCAQAFHWFANTAALAEIRRVLKPGGMLGLIWNVRDESVPWVANLSAITDAYEADTPRYRSGAWRKLFPAKGFECVDERHAGNAHIGPAERVVVDRTLSVSFIAALPPAERDKIAAKVRALIAATPALTGQAEVSFPYVTAMYAYRKAAGPEA